MDELTRLKIEAAAFRGLVQHLQKRSDVQNIDIMNTAGFCRNCLAKWYKAASEHFNSPLSYDGAIVRIRWCVRLRLFIRRGKDFVLEHPFTLGAVPAVPTEPAVEANEEDH